MMHCCVLDLSRLPADQMPDMQEELLQRVITDSRAYGTLLGSGAIGDSGKFALATFCFS